MNEVLHRRFAAMGAEVELHGRPLGMPSIDVAGRRFQIRFPGAGERVEVEAVDVDCADRHLLLLVRNGDAKSKFLCGQDERHWFVAAVPEAARGVTGVTTAKLALQPALVRAEVARRRPKDPFRRRNIAYVRQGEWFFVPVPRLQVAERDVLHNEPLTRGRGNAHVLEEAYRRGGRAVWATGTGNTLTDRQFERLTPDQRRSGRWSRLIRDPELYASGSVRHPDHATVVLRGWHRVVMNTEQSARAMAHVAFLD